VATEISRWLAGRSVVILPDNDEPGRAHAGGVARKLAGIAASVRILDLPGVPPKGDVSDWLAAGGTAADLEELAKAAPPIGADEREHDLAPMAPVIDAGEDTGPIPPRAWLLGNTFRRQFLSGLIGLGGVGKSALRLAQALALASGREDLTGEHVFHQTRVLIVSLEDGLDELRRRVRAARLYHGISHDDVRGWLHLWAPTGLKFAELKDPQSREMKAGVLAAQLRRVIAEREIGLVPIDPFIKTHGADENDNSAIDAVCTPLTGLAIEMHIAVDVLHHDSKSGAQGDPGGSTRGRGASSFRDAGRLLYTVTPMTSTEAASFGLSEAERRALIRLDSAKVNIAAPPAEARWFKIVGVPLGNGTADYPHGDSVQTVERWQPPDFWAAITMPIANEILDQIEKGLPDGSRYSGAAQAGKRAAWAVVQQRLPQLSEEQSRSVIKTWLANKQISHEEYDDPVARKRFVGLVVSGQRLG
jgi:AAA domain-containing protein